MALAAIFDKTFQRYKWSTTQRNSLNMDILMLCDQAFGMALDQIKAEKKVLTYHVEEMESDCQILKNFFAAP